jgi:eukaryotic-like serine/threonine-protein kinase
MSVASSNPIGFDPSHWKRVNAALDQALELDGSDRDEFLSSLASEDEALAREVGRLIDRSKLATSIIKTTPTKPTEPLRTAVVRPGLTVQLATVYGGNSAVAERGFDGLLQRALRAERNTHKSARYRGELCGAWRLKSVIGTGGMGEVWLAERADGLYTAQAAVKFLRQNANMQAFEARFAQERALLARLNHPGIVRLIDAGRQFGDPFLVIEFVEGMQLLNYLVEFAPTVEKRLAIFRAIVEAVSYAHSQLVVHRDLKPSNVLVTPSGQVKLLDFGVAGLLDAVDSDETTESPATKIAGRGLTIEYAAPEQITGEATGVASDIYSLGALGYHILCGHRAHLPEKSGRAALEHAVLHSDPQRLSEAAKTPPKVDARDSFPPPSDAMRIGADLDAIFARTMRREPEARYRTADELIADLRRYSERRPIAARREDRAYRAKLWFRRNWLAAALSTTLLAALAAGLGLSLWQAERARHEALRANLTAGYLSELLSGADPDLHGGNWPSVLNLIERAQRDLSTKFAGEPSVEQRMSHTVATILRRLSRFQDAYPIGKRSYELSRELYGETAESTRMAGALLADIMYWIDKTEEAIPIVERALGTEVPTPMPEWWREAHLLRTNMISELRRFPESYAGYDKYRELIRGHPIEGWLEAESETDRALTMSQEGRHAESLVIHKRYRNALANPPDQAAKRISLTNLSNGYVMSLYMGEPEGLEDAFKRISIDWDRLAGPYNRHSIDALSSLGLYYYYYDRPNETINIYQQRLQRLQELTTPDERQALLAQIDLLEAEARFFVKPVDALLSDANSIERAVIASSVIDESTRNRLLQRLAMVRIGSGDASKLAKSVIELPPTLELGLQRSDRFATRWTATASLLAASGKYNEACDALTFAADQTASKTRVLIGVPLRLRAGLMCTLAGRPERLRHLTLAKAAIPESLPRTHRYRYLIAHLERLAYATTVDEIVQSQKILADQLNTPALVNAHPALLGPVF